MMVSNFLKSRSSEQMPFIAQSEAELVEALGLWIGNNNGDVPTGLRVGSNTVVTNYVARNLIFTGTSEVVVVDLLLVNKTTMGFVLRAEDGSCMLVRPAKGNNSQWRGYNAWLGGDSGFTEAIMASPNGDYHKPSKLTENAIFSEPLKQKRKTNGPDVSSVTNEPLRPYSSIDVEVRRADFAAFPTERSTAIKREPDGHRYPTQERRLATFSKDVAVWESQGNRGEQTPPPQSSFDPIKASWWPFQHAGTPPPTPQTRSKRQKPPHNLQKAASLRLSSPGSSSVELTSVAQISSRGRGRPKTSELGVSNRETRAQRRSSAVKIALIPTTPSCRVPTRAKGAKFRVSTAKLPLTPETTSRRLSNATTTPSPAAPAMNSWICETLKAEPAQAKNIVFHFFLSNETFGAIPKLFTQCATPKSFFEVAHSAWRALGEARDGTRLLGVKVVIEGVTRPIVVLWENEDGFERMMDAISNEMVGRVGNLDVEVRCIELGRAM